MSWDGRRDIRDLDDEISLNLLPCQTSISPFKNEGEWKVGLERAN